MGKSSFLERYLAGEHVPVWRELIELGPKVLDDPLRTDALAVCEEIVRRAHANLLTLQVHLKDLGYEFADPHVALIDAGAGAIDEIAKAERELGAFPLIARVWYQTFASVDFCQADHQRAYWEGIRPPEGPDIFGLGSHPVLIFQSFEDARAQLQHMAAEKEEYIRQMKEDGWDESSEHVESGKFFPLGGWASNCEPKGFPLPSCGIDGVIYNDGGVDTYFVDELRSAFRWGGFPFWQWVFTEQDFYSPMEYRPNFEKLLPVLKEGLLEL